MVKIKSYTDGLREGLEHADNTTKNNAIKCIRLAFQLHWELQVKEFRLLNLYELKGMAYMLLWTDILTKTQYCKLMKRINQLITIESEVI